MNLSHSLNWLDQQTDRVSSVILYPSIVVVLVYLLYRAFVYDPKRRYLPAGPRGWPIIGNTLQINFFGNPQPLLIDWSKKYGDLFYLRIGATDFVFVNTPKAVKDLFDKRGAIYADKPYLPMAGETLARGFNLALMGYNERWKTHRRLIQGVLTMKQAETYRPIQEFESKQLAVDWLNTPERFYEHTRRYAGSLIMQVVYGRRFPTSGSKEAMEIYECNEHFASVGPGSYIVDTFPGLAKIPGFGTVFGNWKKIGNEMFKYDSKIFLKLYRRMKQDLNEKSGYPCFARDLELSDPESHGLSELEAAYLSAGLVQPGSESTAALLNWLVRCLATWPDVQAQAHEELDRVVGTDRTPVWDDEPKLPFIRAMVKELLRYAPGSKFGVPHCTTQDDWYNGMFIPKGAMVVVNLWALQFDDTRFPDPWKYNPARYLGTPALERSAFENMNAADPETRDHWAYGAGRRWCPGIHVAEKSLFINIAKMMWGFEIEKRGDWEVYEPEAGWLNLPAPCDVKIRPRSEKHERVMREEWGQAKKEGLHYHPAPREVFPNRKA